MFNFTITQIFETSQTNDGEFLKTPFWCEFKELHGWQYMRFLAKWMSEGNGKENFDGAEKGENKKEGEAEFSVLVRSFCKGIFSIAYIPLFPEIEKTSDIAINFAHFLSEISDSLEKFLPKNTICIRFDPKIEFLTPKERDDFNYGVSLVSFADKLKVKKCKTDIQPPDTTQIDLTFSTDEILSKMKSKWRYNINLSVRKGVEIEKVFGQDENFLEKLDIFYDLYKITSERDGIALHAKKYYEDLLKKSSDEISQGEDVPKITLYLAKNENDYLAAIITLFSKTESVYLYGCSSNVKRNLMPNFLLQWTAMTDAKEYGSKYYDMYGMPPTDDENHPMHGLYLFKTGFGGKNIHRVGTYDVPLKTIFYKIATFAENVRAFWHKKVLKKVRGR